MLAGSLDHLKTLVGKDQQKRSSKLADTERNRRLYMLLGGRSGRVHLAKDDETGEYIQVIHDGNSSPLLEIVYTFFKEPTSSPPAKLWALVMCLLALSRVLAMACETVNGPQFYEGRPNQSIYPWMPDHNTYYMLYLSMCIPFLVDAVGRLVVVCASFSDWDGPCAKAFRQDKLAQFLTACNIISVIPFVAGLFLFPGTYSYDKILYSTGRISAAAHLNKISSTEAIRVLFRVMNLLVSSHVLRYVKHLTVIKTVALALSRAGPHLVLPIFFFFVFNIIFGVVFYFAEPCYDTSSCPWQDMLDSTFFSIVAMCTVGYGNQVPATDFGRFVTVFVMLFGALFISMPLALIGNEYTDAVVEVQQQIEAEQELWAQRAESISAARETHRIQLKLLGQLVPTAHDSEESKTEDTQEISPEELELSQIRKSLLMQYFSKIQVCATLLEYQLDKAIEGKRNFDAVYITAPALLLQAETMAAMPPFMAALKGSTVAVIRDAVITKNTDIVESNTTANSGPDEQSETLAKDAKTAKEQAADEKNTNHKKNYKNKIKNKKKRGKGSNTRKDSDIISLPSSGAGSDMDDEDSSISEVGEEGGTDSNESEDDMAKAIDQSKVGDDYIKSMQRQFAAQKSAPGPMRDSFRMAISSQKRSNKAKKRIAKGLSFVESFSLPTPIQNFFSRLKSIIGTGLDGKPMRPTLRARVQYEENAFTTKLRRVLDNPKTLHHRVWMFLELPHSSKQAYYYRLLMLCFIVLSVSVFFLETLNYFHSYGPDTKICGDVLMQYCSNKSPSTDPGCFVQTQTGTTTVALSYINNRYLFPQQMYDPVQDPTGTAYAYYEMPVIDANWESYYSQPTDAQTLQDSVTMMIDSCYRTHRDKWNSQTRKFPHMPGDAGNNIKAGYPYPLPNNEVAYMSYPLNECHRFGFNLGTHIFQVQNVTQVLDSHMPPTGSNVEVSVVNVPYSPVSCTDETKKSYQDVDELVYTFGAIGATTSRGKVQQQAAICSRIECSGQPAASDLGKYFKYIEVACFAMFLIDICARMFISDSLWLFFTDKIALLDLVALSPFVILIVQQTQQYPFSVSIISISDLNVSILSSSPGPFYTTILRACTLLRLVRLTRQFTVTQVLVDTAKKCFQIIAAMEAVLSIVLLVFSVLIYELERGSECFVAPSPEAIVNDLRNEFSYCQVVPSEVEHIVHPGDRLLINKNGDISKFSNIVDCMWFCYVTATTTGFGDRWPITNGGMYVNLFLMLSGSLYLAMPLTVASGTYYAAHTRYLKSKKKTQALQTLSGAKLAPFHAASFTPAVQNSLQRLYEVLKAELAEMRLITNHMRREHVSYLKFEDKKGGQKHKTEANKDSEEDSSDDSSVSEDQPWEKPPLTRELLKSVNRLQEVLRMSKKDVQELALLDYRRMEHLNKLEEWSSTNFDR